MLIFFSFLHIFSWKITNIFVGTHWKHLSKVLEASDEFNNRGMFLWKNKDNTITSLDQQTKVSNSLIVNSADNKN